MRQVTQIGPGSQTSQFGNKLHWAHDMLSVFKKNNTCGKVNSISCDTADANDSMIAKITVGERSTKGTGLVT